MAITFTPITSWSTADVLHFARRAGFGLRPEQAALLAAQDPATVIEGWVDGTPGIVGDATLFHSVLADRADVVAAPAWDAYGGTAQPAVQGLHPFYVQGPEAWRTQFGYQPLAIAQGYCTFRMQYNPHGFSERMALFLHNLLATSIDKVNHIPLMINQMDLFRAQGAGRYEDLLVAVAQDPAMCWWLDSQRSKATWASIPNENLARELLELYSVGVDNGYTQADITNLAYALSGWSYIVAPGQWWPNPALSQSAPRGVPGVPTFTVYQGQAMPPGSLWFNFNPPGPAGTTLNLHPTDAASSHSLSTTISFLGSTYDFVTPDPGMVPGENALRGIFKPNPAGLRTNASEFMAKRLLIHFVTPDYTASDLQDLAALIRTSDFHLGTVLKALFKSTWFFAADKRYVLVEGPVSWAVRAVRMLCPELAAADGPQPSGFPANKGKAFPAWAYALGKPQNPSDVLDNMGMRLLGPAGPNGWAEHTAWLNSNTVRYRGMFAAAVALGELVSHNFSVGAGPHQDEPLTLFPNQVQAWFPTPPATALGAYNRLVELLQPAPIPIVDRDGWLSSLFGASSTTVNPTNPADQVKLRELAYLILCCPSGQLY
ncbi:MAG TPA: DUF1800 family protein [Holophagaceae bacterium]|nr:DUF1800 family protein [Holophagaceae bacterium]